MSDVKAFPVSKRGTGFAQKSNCAGNQGREPPNVAKKVLPIHLDTREREILRRLSERDGVSMAEIVRRSIRNLALDVIDPKALERPSAMDHHTV